MKDRSKLKGRKVRSRRNAHVEVRVTQHQDKTETARSTCCAHKWSKFTDLRKFPRSISVKSIVAVMSQMRDATTKFAIATTWRMSFATKIGSTLYPPLS